MLFLFQWKFNWFIFASKNFLKKKKQIVLVIKVHIVIKIYDACLCGSLVPTKYILGKSDWIINFVEDTRVLIRNFYVLLNFNWSQNTLGMIWYWIFSYFSYKILLKCIMTNQKLWLAWWYAAPPMWGGAISQNTC